MSYQVIIKIVMLLGLVGISAYTDIKDRLILNKVTFPFAIAGIVVNTLFDFPGGFITGALGLAFGFALFFVPVLMNAMGAGDLKLMAAIGAITNPMATLYITVATTLVGGVMIIGVRLKQREMLSTLVRMGKLILFYFFSLIYMIAEHPKIYIWRENNRLDMTDDRIDYIPYGVAIAGGTLVIIGFVLFDVVPGLTL